ncbi:MAG: hypothetical protein ACI4JX_03560 [Oscillospiraceae bacterium]
MNDYEFARMVTECIKKSEKSSGNKCFVLKTETIIKLKRILGQIKSPVSTSFDFAFNAIDIRLNDYVFDSKTDGIKQALCDADLFVIDAEKDGKICIEIRILNAANIF